MLLFRPVNQHDLPAIYKLAQHASVGLTSFPADKTILATKIARACESFSKLVRKPHDELYFFALEDTAHKQVIGVSAIEAAVGFDVPFFSYKLSQVSRISHVLQQHNDYQVLFLVNDYQGQSELCTLYLNPDFRQQGAGRMLSLLRFLYIANFPHRFTEKIFAEMRGVSDDAGNSPFWQALPKHFFKMKFSEADYLSATTNKQFIIDLMPRHPIYLNLINKKGLAVIGQPHRATKPALHMLEKEGFIWNHYIDIFDGGPTIEATKHSIRTINASYIATVAELRSEIIGDNMLLANCHKEFRATSAPIYALDKKHVALSRNVAKLLRIDVGDKCRIAPFPPSSKSKR